MSAELALIQDEAQFLEQELLRRFYRQHPVAWAEDVLGVKLWSAQRKVLDALRDHRRVAVQSCHDIGKSFITAVAICWWISTDVPGEAFVVTTAPTGPQVKAILWREINRAHSRGDLPGRTNQTEWHLESTSGKEELVAYGRKPDEHDPAAFQGIHARRVLVALDEACGVRGPLWDAADSLIANEESKALAIGNPDDPTTEFADLCKPGSGWHVIQVGAFDTPAFTGELIPKDLAGLLISRTYVEEKRRKWAPAWRWTADNKRVVPPEGIDPTDTHPFWQSKVLGLFPRASLENGLIPFVWVRAAMERELAPSEPNELGVDVGAGGDSSTVAHRRGPVVRLIHEDHNPDTMQTCGKVVTLRRQTGATSVKVDKIGIGKGIYDRSIELAQEKVLDAPFVGVSVGEQARDAETFANLKAELWWGVRERFESGEVDLDPLDEDTAAELVSLRYKRTSAGKILIESKDDAKRRGVPSPNRAEAVMLAFAPVTDVGGPQLEVLW